MFNLDSFREIFLTIRKNKMRTALTGFAVAWGIFMLIVLLAAGNGLKNGVLSNFAHRATNAVRIWPGRTSVAYQGLPVNRRVKFDHRDISMLTRTLPEIEYISAGGGESVTLTYEQEYASIFLECMTPGGAQINNLKVEKGRFINEMDMRDRRKVVVLHPDHAKILFDEQDPIGKLVTTKGLVYTVIGIYSDLNIYESNPSAYIPLTAATIIYNERRGFQNLEFTVLGLNTLEDNERFETRLRTVMGNFHRFDPEDRTALNVWSSSKEAIETQNILTILSLFIIVIGLASLMAGVVGVGNIMLITVRERTREIGIRKAIGATRFSILWLIISESIVITTIAGYIGIILGVGTTELLSKYMFSAESQDGMTMFINPTVELSTVIWATVLLIVAGIVAGLIPALKATKVSPIEAMMAD